ncbi:MAG TPA: glycosyltransferase [Planctomycetaceae bacterium]|nr:glycosyltransferase [Planctomycetaceae bacterium]
MLLQTRPAAQARPERRSTRPESLPQVDVIVAFHNEARLLPDKLANLLDLDYPADLLRFVLVDGKSTDGSLAIAETAAQGDSRFTVVRSPVANKTLQINLALTRCRAPWVLYTDVDAHLPENTLRELVAVVAPDPRIAVAGVLHRPGCSTSFDQRHWRFWNASRRFERRTGSTSAVLGPCYLFRRNWLFTLPADVIADDMYVSFAALASGRRIALAETLVIERRAPGGTVPVLFHKIRKARALLREVLRFLPRARRTPSPMRELFLWRAAVTMAAPPAILAAFVVSLAIAPAAGTVFWLMGLACCFFPLEERMPWRLGRTAIAVAALVGLGLTLACVLCVALVSLPFVSQQASFSRWRQEER